MLVKKGILYIFIIVLIFTLVSFAFLGKSLFLVKNIKITKDFEVDKEKLLNYLEIYPIRSIFNYDTNMMENKLSRHYYLKEYKVSKIYPNTLEIKILIRNPIAKIIGKNGYLYNIDKEGVVFGDNGINRNTNPLVIIDKGNGIKEGIKISGYYEDFLDRLTFIKEKRSDLYSSISQIEVLNNSNYGLDYIVNFKTLSNSIYLKKNLDVDSIRKGLSCLKYLDKSYINGKILFYTDNAFKLAM